MHSQQSGGRLPERPMVSEDSSIPCPRCGSPLRMVHWRSGTQLLCRTEGCDDDPLGPPLGAAANDRGAAVSTRRMVVAFEAVETRESRWFRQAATGQFEGAAAKPQPLGTFWCAADDPGPDVPTRPIYRTHKVPEGAHCEVCWVEIADLQREMTRLVASTGTGPSDG